MRDLPQHGGASSDADLIDLALVGHAALFVLRSPRRHPWLATGAFVTVMAAAIAAALLFPKRYEVSTTILAGSPLTGALVGERERERDAPLKAAREILLRRENLEALVEETDFANRYLTNRPAIIKAVHGVMSLVTGKERDPKAVVDGLVDSLEDRLWVSVTSENTVSITLQWWDPQMALDVVEAAGKSFLKMRYAAEIKTISESISILEEHRANLETKVQEKIAALEAREKAENSDKKASRPAPRIVPKSDPELARLQAMLAANRRTIADLETSRQQRVVQLQADLIQQQSIYASDHPALMATQRMLETMQQPSTQLGQLRLEGRALEADILARGGKAEASRASAVSPDAGSDSSPLLFEQDPREEYERGELRHLRVQLADTIDRIAGARLQMDTASAAFKHRYSVIAPARIPKGPIKRYTTLFLASGIMGGIALALLASVAADLREDKVVERWQIEHRLGLPVLGQSRR